MNWAISKLSKYAYNKSRELRQPQKLAVKLKEFAIEQKTYRENKLCKSFCKNYFNIRAKLDDIKNESEIKPGTSENQNRLLKFK